MATRYQFVDDSGETRLAGFLVPEPVGSFARVQRITTAITNWDGSTIPFNSVTVDADSLWDATNHQFVAKVAGWYRIECYSNHSDGGVSFTTPAGSYQKVITAVVFGAGDNIYANAGGNGSNVVQVVFPALVGETHLDIGDAVVMQGDGGTGWVVAVGCTFSIQLVI